MDLIWLMVLWSVLSAFRFLNPRPLHLYYGDWPPRIQYNNFIWHRVFNYIWLSGSASTTRRVIEILYTAIKNGPVPLYVCGKLGVFDMPIQWICWAMIIESTTFTMSTMLLFEPMHFLCFHGIALFVAYMMGHISAIEIDEHSLIAYILRVISMIDEHSLIVMAFIYAWLLMTVYLANIKRATRLEQEIKCFVKYLVYQYRRYTKTLKMEYRLTREAEAVLKERRNLAMLAHCLQREERGKMYDLLDAPFMEANFLPLLDVPKHTLIMAFKDMVLPTAFLYEKNNRHTDAIAAYNGKLYCGTWQGTITVWDRTNGNFLHDLEGHTNNIGYLIIDDGKLYSRSRDAIKIWNCYDDSLITTLMWYSDIFTISDGKLYSANLQRKDEWEGVTVWSCKTYAFISSFRTTVSQFVVHGDKMYCTGHGKSIESSARITVLNSRTGAVLTDDLSGGHTQEVNCLLIDDDKLYSASLDCTIKIWNCSTDTLIKTLTGHTGSVSCLTIHDGKLYSCGGYGDLTIKVWNCSNNLLIKTIKECSGYSGHLTHLSVGDDNKLYLMVRWANPYDKKAGGILVWKI